MTNKPFSLAELMIEPGTHQLISFPAPNLNTQIKMTIPVHVFHGKYAGPKVFIIGTIHGDELNSIEILRRVHHHIRVSKLHGTIITLPVANVYGLIMGSRYLPDRRDLNRMFPGAKTGTLANRLAHGICNVFSLCDYGIDLHTGGLGHMNVPQLRVHLATSGTKELAHVFDAPVILDSKLREGSLRQVAHELGIPFLVYEGGEALRFNELCIRAGVNGILNVFSHLKMLPHRSAKPLKKYKPLVARTSRWLRASVSGFVQPEAGLIARHVKKGELLASIHDPFLINKSVKVEAPFEGVVIGQALKPLVSEGDALFHIASFHKIKGVAETIDEYKVELVGEGY
ncbi:MAG: succinylglutamate desuccinylase/aspartoacylase family protein [Gammaproteobacteria bacterium]|nr:succinylglutamate desuccinylase/aspartoacylase family protein [Gammaproteobacteria bacterium]